MHPSLLSLCLTPRWLFLPRNSVSSRSSLCSSALDQESSLTCASVPEPELDPSTIPAISLPHPNNERPRTTPPPSASWSAPRRRSPTTPRSRNSSIPQRQARRQFSRRSRGPAGTARAAPCYAHGKYGSPSRTRTRPGSCPGTKREWRQREQRSSQQKRQLRASGRSR